MDGSQPASVAISRQISHGDAMLLLLKLILWSVRSLALSRQALLLDNLALRQQLAVATRGGRAPATAHRRSHVLGCVARGVDRLECVAGDRETRHRRRLTPSRLRCLLASPLPQTGTAPNRPAAARSDCSHGEGERVGSAMHPRRTASSLAFGSPSGRSPGTCGRFGRARQPAHRGRRSWTTTGTSSPPWISSLSRRSPSGCSTSCS